MELPAFFSVGSTATMAVSWACAAALANAPIHNANRTIRLQTLRSMVTPFGLCDARGALALNRTLKHQSPQQMQAFGLSKSVKYAPP
jgi:hypothetical protein